jgi:hypothetical protein
LGNTLKGAEAMNITEKVSMRVKMLGGNPNKTDILDYSIKKAMRDAADFCNMSELPQETEIYIVEWAAAEYLTGTDGYSKQWDSLRNYAEKGLIRFRRMRW